MNILYEDNHLLVVVKPPNMPVQADESGDADLLSILKDYIKQKYGKPGEVYLALVHRLDRPVGGVMVFARTSKAASRLSAQFSGRGTKKRYMALVEGAPSSRARLEDMLGRDGVTAYIAAAGEPGAKAAALAYERIASHDGLSLLDIELFTGRHHQIRVQLASRGIPIFGDARYNPSAKPGEQIALFACSLEFEHPTLKKRMTFTARPENTGAWALFCDEAACLSRGLRLVYADSDMLVLNKRPGMEVAEADGGDASMEARLSDIFAQALPVHRLDFNTTGLVIFARSAAAKARLTDDIRERRVKKFYRCLVSGEPQKEFELRDYGIKDAEKARLYVYSEPRALARELILRCRRAGRVSGFTLLEVELVTGRTHQIRAQLAFHGLPVLGDDKYGDRDINRAAKRSVPALCAVRVELNGQVFEVQEDF